MYRIVSPSRASAALSFTKVWAREGVSERQWRSAANRSPLPLRSVLDAPHRGAGPEPAGETGVGSCPGVIFSKGGKPPLLYPPHGGEHSPVPPPTRRGSGLGCRLGRSWTVPTGHQAPPRTPQGPACPWPAAKGFPQAIPTLAYPFRRPRRDGGSLPQNSAGRSPEKFSCQARLRFQNSGTPFVEEFFLSPRAKSHCVQTYYELSSLPLG